MTLFRMYANNSNSRLILPLGIVREPTVWVCHALGHSGVEIVTFLAKTGLELGG